VPVGIARHTGMRARGGDAEPAAGPPVISISAAWARSGSFFSPRMFQISISGA